MQEEMTSKYMEREELLKWVWNKIRPKAPYCNILDEDQKAYDTIKNILMNERGEPLEDSPTD
jgi:hypothetical protein